jgi:4-diphosphocytidyl-2-C-methyl-D-erythritol kinase
MTRLVAPAKLTVSLAITGVRADGYHELRAEMVSLDLADELTFSEGDPSGITVDAQPGSRADGLDTGPTNLIARALAASGRSASVHVVKRIPLGGGLGGGSTDAAAVLRWAGCTDLSTAVALGADVPFCLEGGRAMVEGIGEQLTPLPFAPRTFLLCIPPFGVNTERVYAAWDDQPDDQGPNALTEAALRVEPRLAVWRDALGELSGQMPVLAGSGSTWFVEDTPDETGARSMPTLAVGEEQATLVRAATVPSGWHG